MTHSDDKMTQMRQLARRLAEAEAAGNPVPGYEVPTIEDSLRFIFASLERQTRLKQKPRALENGKRLVRHRERPTGMRAAFTTDKGPSKRLMIGLNDR